ncbi:C/D box methylation guide ribonucleoprotein complex aNOP56 subunit [Thermococcus sp.]
MKAFIAENVRGIYAFDENGSVIAHRPFERVGSLDSLLVGEVTEEMLNLMEELKDKGYDEMVFEHPELSRKANELGFNADFEFPNLAGGILREKPEEFLGKNWFGEYFRAGVELTRTRIQEQSGARDKMVVQAIEALDDIDKVTNLMVSRLREWYSLHFPEIDEILPKHQQYVVFVKEVGLRENITKEKLEKLGLSEGKIEKILVAKDRSMGAVMGRKDIEIIQRLAAEIDDLYKLREKIEDYLEEAMDDVAPNLKALVGAKLAARLISLAGGLRELAMMPSSTIQVLGAEKALFRHLRSGAKPPKHGVIYQYPAINRSPWWQRGKIARALAGKLAIAARVDYFSGEYIAEELKQEVEARIKEIKEKYPNPPKRKAEKPKKKSKGKKFKKGKFKGKKEKGKGKGKKKEKKRR